jgi:hypothetical protein
MALVVNPDCPQQYSYVGVDGGTRTFGNYLFNCKKSNAGGDGKASIGKEDQGVVFSDPFGEAVVYEADDAVNCPKKDVCYVVEIYESAKRRGLIDRVFASGSIVISGGQCPLADPSTSCTFPDQYLCETGEGVVGNLTCGVGGTFEFRCSGEEDTPPLKYAPGIGKECFLDGAEFECGNLLTDAADTDYVGVFLRCNAETKRMGVGVWGSLMSSSE